MYLQLNTRFNPFTYDEMVKPLLYYKQAYDAKEAAYSDLITRAEQWKAIAESDDSPIAKAMYQNYSNDLYSAVSDFSRGMTASNSGALLDMRMRYAREIQPIEIAFKRKAQLDDEQRKLLASDPSIIFQRRVNEMSLDDFIKNPNLNYGEVISGADITKRASFAAANLAKEARDSAEGRRKLRAILPYQFEYTQQRGFSSDSVIEAIMNSPNADKLLTGLVDNIVASSGVLGWNDPKAKDRVYDYARQGLWSSVGDTKSQIITDNYNMRAELARMDPRGKQDPPQKDLAINPLNLYSSRKLSEEEKKYKENIDRFSKYFDKDPLTGKFVLNEDGIEEYNETHHNPGVQIKVPKEYYDPRHSQLYLFINNMGYNNPKDSNKTDPLPKEQIENVFNDYVNNSPARTAQYDATKVTEYEYAIDESDQEGFKNSVLIAHAGAPLMEVDYDEDLGVFTPTGNSLSIKDFSNDKYKIPATRVSVYGNSMLVLDDEGNRIRFALPAGINSVNESNRDKELKAADAWAKVYTTGTFIGEDGNTYRATPDDIAYAKKQYHQAIRQAYLYHSQIGLKNRIPDQEYNPYGY